MSDEQKKVNGDSTEACVCISVCAQQLGAQKKETDGSKNTPEGSCVFGAHNLAM